MIILLVDDHPLVREAMQHVLVGLGDNITILGAGDVPGALELMARSPEPDLVLLDLSLPGPSGMDALHTMRERHPAIPVVVLSASDDAGTVVNALDRGAMGFIPKCSNNAEIVDAIRQVLSGGIYVPPRMAGIGVSPSAPRPQAVHAMEPELTERQAEVLALMVQGLPNKAICRKLNLAEGTVKVHVSGILKVLNVANRTQAVVAARQMGLKLPV